MNIGCVRYFKEKSERTYYRIQYFFLKKNQSAPRPSEHPPVNVKTFRWDHNRLQIQNLFMTFKTGSPMQITLGQQYNVGEKPTVILYIYINRHAGTSEKH